MNSIRDNCERIRERIARAAARAGRSPDAVRLIAVSKTVPAEHMIEAALSGVRDFGENRLQEGMSKRDAWAGPAVTWHFVGHIQTKKIRRIVQIFDVVHSVDRAQVAGMLHDAAVAPLPVYIEVRTDPAATKSGVDESGLQTLIDHVRSLDRLELLGLMTVPPFVDPAERLRPHFARLRELAFRHGLNRLSMGMSHDFEIAIEEGATEIRVGTALFGARTSPP